MAFRIPRLFGVSINCFTAAEARASGQTISILILQCSLPLGPRVAYELLRKLHVASHGLRQGHEA